MHQNPETVGLTLSHSHAVMHYFALDFLPDPSMLSKDSWNRQTAFAIPSPTTETKPQPKYNESAPHKQQDRRYGSKCQKLWPSGQGMCDGLSTLFSPGSRIPNGRAGRTGKVCLGFVGVSDTGIL